MFSKNLIYTLVRFDGFTYSSYGEYIIALLKRDFRSKKCFKSGVDSYFGFDHGTIRVGNRWSLERYSSNSRTGIEWLRSFGNKEYSYDHKYIIYDGNNRIISPSELISLVASSPQYSKLPDTIFEYYKSFFYRTLQTGMGRKARPGRVACCSNSPKYQVDPKEYQGDYGEPPIRNKARHSATPRYDDYFYAKQSSNWKRYRKKQYKGKE